MRDIEREQIEGSTDAQLRDRLKALRTRFDPKHDGGHYPMAQLRELQIIKSELTVRRSPQVDESDRVFADNHSALFAATDIEWSLKYGR